MLELTPVALTPRQRGAHYAALLMGSWLGLGAALRFGKVITLLMLHAPVLGRYPGEVREAPLPPWLN